MSSAIFIGRNYGMHFWSNIYLLQYPANETPSYNIADNILALYNKSVESKYL